MWKTCVQILGVDAVGASEPALLLYFPPFPVCVSDSHTIAYLLPVEVQIVSVLLNESGGTSGAENDAGFSGKNDTLGLLDSLAAAVAIEAEAGEDVDEVSAGSVELQVRSGRWLIQDKFGYAASFAEPSFWERERARKDASRVRGVTAFLVA